MRSGGRGQPRLRLGERGLLQTPKPPSRRLLPRAQLLPLLLLALALASAFYIVWSGWPHRSEELPPGRDLRVRTGGGTAGALSSSSPLTQGLGWTWLYHMALAAGVAVVFKTPVSGLCLWACSVIVALL